MLIYKSPVIATLNLIHNLMEENPIERACILYFDVLINMRILFKIYCLPALKKFTFAINSLTEKLKDKFWITYNFFLIICLTKKFVRNRLELEIIWCLHLFCSKSL